MPSEKVIQPKFI